MCNLQKKLFHLLNIFQPLRNILFNAHLIRYILLRSFKMHSPINYNIIYIFSGRAFLFKRVVNLTYTHIQDRVMLTGRHMVRDVMCKKCKAKLGWMYEYATEESQKYLKQKQYNYIDIYVDVHFQINLFIFQIQGRSSYIGTSIN